MNTDNNDPKKSIDNLSNDQVDGKDVKGGFGPTSIGGPGFGNPAPDMLPDGPPVDDGLGGPHGEIGGGPLDGPLDPNAVPGPDLPGQMPGPIGSPNGPRLRP